MALFRAPGLAASEIREEELGELQRLFEEAPGYNELAEGQPVAGDAARETYDARPPSEWPYSRRWLIGFREGPELVAVADVVSDLLAPGVWHVGLFLLPERRHGTGLAPRAYEALETWMRASGAHWLRLGVIEGNLRAERFWRRRGYVETRRRGGVAMGRKTQTIIVMAKPLVGGTLARYLALVPRDRPESA
jgi:GNAT superfamily N-acetyltransferase